MPNWIDRLPPMVVPPISRIAESWAPSPWFTCTLPPKVTGSSLPTLSASSAPLPNVIDTFLVNVAPSPTELPSDSMSIVSPLPLPTWN